MCVTLHPLSSFSIRMQKTFLLLFLFLFPSSNVSTRTATPEKTVATSVPAPQKMDGEQLFEDMQLGGVVNFLAFRQAVAGYNLIKQKSKSILTLIDFTKPSTEKRLFVFDMEQKKMLYSSVDLDDLVARIAQGEGTIGKLISDPELYDSLEKASDNLAALLADVKQYPGRYVHLSLFGRNPEKMKERADKKAAKAAAKAERDSLRRLQ